MAVFRTKWETSQETYDFEAPDENEALLGLARETGILTGLARVSRVTVVATEQRGGKRTRVKKTETVVPIKGPDEREVWERNHGVRPRAPGATLLSTGSETMKS